MTPRQAAELERLATLRGYGRWAHLAAEHHPDGWSASKIERHGLTIREAGRVIMAATHEYVKTVERLERLRTSVNGNPRFRIHFTDGTAMQTQSDADVNYGLSNPENMGVPVKVRTTRAGRVWDVHPVGNPSGRVAAED